MNIDPSVAGPPGNGIPIQGGPSTETALEGAIQASAEVATENDSSAGEQALEGQTEDPF